MSENEENNTNGFCEKYKNINPHLQHMAEDTLYHIGLTSGKEDLKKMFGDVKVIKSFKFEGKYTFQNTIFYFLQQNSTSMSKQYWFNVNGMTIPVCLYGWHSAQDGALCELHRKRDWLYPSYRSMP